LLDQSLASSVLAIYIDRHGEGTTQEVRQKDKRSQRRSQACPHRALHSERRTRWIIGEDQRHWVDSALEIFGRVFGGATAFPRATGIWRDDERGGRLVKDEPVVVHCYTTPADIEDDRNLPALGAFCRRLGREGRQGEVGLVVGDEYFAIRDFTQGETT
jgi:hypothetical protein